MVTGQILTRVEKECMAKQIRQLLLDNGLWKDTSIYFNGKAFSTDDRCGHYYYNDPEHLIVLENQNPINYFAYVSKDNILSMSFESDFCYCFQLSSPRGVDFDRQIIKEFEAILDSYDVYYELGDHWNLTCFYRSK